HGADLSHFHRRAYNEASHLTALTPPWKCRLHHLPPESDRHLPYVLLLHRSYSLKDCGCHYFGSASRLPVSKVPDPPGSYTHLYPPLSSSRWDKRPPVLYSYNPPRSDESVRRH